VTRPAPVIHTSGACGGLRFPRSTVRRFPPRRAAGCDASPPRPRSSHRRGTILTTFRSLGVLPAVADALEARGIVEPFPIQAMTLPVALGGSDIIGQAKTGTGKTLAYGVPLLQRIAAGPAAGHLTSGHSAAGGRPHALVVVPTRELCSQVTADLAAAAALSGARVLAVYGGRAFEPQVAALARGVDVVVGTPGRLLDLARRRHLDLSGVQVLVLDEADEMLDLGFLPDVESIIAATPASRQTMLFSATMPASVAALARRYLRTPTRVRADDPADTGATVAAVTQHVFRAHAMDKVEILARILQAEGRHLSMVFCRTKRTAAKVAEDLAGRGFAAAAVHGDLGQGAREQALRAFRGGKVDVLVATDVAARGIDVQDVTHVVNFQCPEDENTYLHRIGRTGRAGRSGIAVTFVDWDDLHTWGMTNRALNLPFADPVETYSTSEHLYEALAIPAGAGGVLPRAQRVRAGLAAEHVEDLGERGRAAGRRAPAQARKRTVPQAEARQRALPQAEARQRAVPAGPRRRRRSRHQAAPAPHAALRATTAAPAEAVA
jgi:superfamily II DNA/RNA helicase